MIYIFIFLFFFGALCTHDHLKGSPEPVSNHQDFHQSSAMSDSWVNPINEESQGVRSHLRDASIETTKLQECVVNLQEKVETFKFELQDARLAEAARGDTILILQNQVKRLEAINAATHDELCTLRKKSNNAEVEIRHLKQRCLALKEERTKLQNELIRCSKAGALASLLKPDEKQMKKMENEKKLEEERNRHLISHLEGIMCTNKALVMEKEALISENLVGLEKMQEETQFWKMKYKECVEKLDALERSSASSKLNCAKVQGTVDLLKRKIALVQQEKNAQLKLADDLIRLSASSNPSSSEIALIIIPILQIIHRRISLLQKVECEEVVPRDVKSKNIIHVWYLLRNILSLLCVSSPWKLESRGESELICDTDNSNLKELSCVSHHLNEMLNSHSSNAHPNQSAADNQSALKSDKILDVANISVHFSKIGTQLRNLGEMFRENSNDMTISHVGDLEKPSSLKSKSDSAKTLDKFSDLMTVSNQLENLGEQFKCDSENIRKLSVLSQHLDKLGIHLHNLGELFSTYDLFFKPKTPGKDNHETYSHFKKSDSKWAPQLSTLFPLCFGDGTKESRSATIDEVDWKLNSNEVSGFSHLMDSKVASKVDHLICEDSIDISSHFGQKTRYEKNDEVATQIKNLFFGQPSNDAFPTRSTDKASLDLISPDITHTNDSLIPDKLENAFELGKDGAIPSWKTLLVGLWLNKDNALGRRTVSEPSLCPKTECSKKNICSIDANILPRKRKDLRSKTRTPHESIGDQLSKDQCSIEALKQLGQKRKMTDQKKIKDLRSKLNSEKSKRFSFSVQVKKLLSDLQRKLDVDVQAKRASMNRDASMEQHLCETKHQTRSHRMEY